MSRVKFQLHIGGDPFGYIRDITHDNYNDAIFNLTEKGIKESDITEEKIDLELYNMMERKEI